MKIEELLIERTGKKIVGMDSDDNVYESLKDLWIKELVTKSKKRNNNKKIKKDWYTHAFEYWEDENICPATDNGVLQGYGHVTETDARDSRLFIDYISTLQPQLKYECAAGSNFLNIDPHFL